MGESKKRRKKREVCNFLVANIGKLPFADIKDHVEVCGDCRSFLNLNWQNYISLSAPNSKVTNMPNDLKMDEYLEIWHIIKKRERRKKKSS